MALPDVQEMADLDVDEIMAKQVEQLEKEKKELQERLRGQEKKVLYATISHPHPHPNSTQCVCLFGERSI